VQSYLVQATALLVLLYPWKEVGRKADRKLDWIHNHLIWVKFIPNYVMYYQEC